MGIILDKNYQLNIDLGKKYNAPPVLIGYIRSAILKGKFTKETLITHILQANTRRLNLLMTLQKRTDINDIHKKEIEALQEKVEMRKLALHMLENITPEQLTDILQPDKR